MENVDYSYAMNRALNYIEHNLMQVLDLEEIANRANYSLFHFHRIFQKSNGISLKSYIRKRRLSEAARDVLFSKIPLKKIAGDYCFDSQESFTRAFRKEFNKTPGEMRRNSLSFHYFEPIIIRKDKIYNRKGDIMTPQIIEIKDIKVVGIKDKSTINQNTIPQLWDRFNHAYCTIKNKSKDARCLGICFYTGMTDFNNDTEFEYLASVEVDNFDEIPEKMMKYVVKGGKYAVFTHVGTLANLKNTYSFIYNEWLPSSGYDFAKSDDFELYDHRFKFGQEDSEFDIYIPIK
ncbi:MAG: AraC family transcriptional regulator [Candidatus Cloacimonetes bacterium]|nr:AraC family transcriptional regulator [Candidatus Cloacimonadota bacterium]